MEKNSGAEGLFLRNWLPDTYFRDNGHNVSWSGDRKLLRVVRELTERGERRRDTLSWLWWTTQ